MASVAGPDHRAHPAGQGASPGYAWCIRGAAQRLPALGTVGRTLACPGRRADRATSRAGRGLRSCPAGRGLVAAGRRARDRHGVRVTGGHLVRKTLVTDPETDRPVLRMAGPGSPARHPGGRDCRRLSGGPHGAAHGRLAGPSPAALRSGLARLRKAGRLPVSCMGRAARLAADEDLQAGERPADANTPDDIVGVGADLRAAGRCTGTAGDAQRRAETLHRQYRHLRRGGTRPSSRSSTARYARASAYATSRSASSGTVPDGLRMPAAGSWRLCVSTGSTRGTGWRRPWRSGCGRQEVLYETGRQFEFIMDRGRTAALGGAPWRDAGPARPPRPAGLGTAQHHPRHHSPGH